MTVRCTKKLLAMIRSERLAESLPGDTFGRLGPGQVALTKTADRTQRSGGDSA